MEGPKSKNGLSKNGLQDSAQKNTLGCKRRSKRRAVMGSKLELKSFAEYAKALKSQGMKDRESTSLNFARYLRWADTKAEGGRQRGKRLLDLGTSLSDGFLPLQFVDGIGGGRDASEIFQCIIYLESALDLSERESFANSWKVKPNPSC